MSANRGPTDRTRPRTRHHGLGTDRRVEGITRRRFIRNTAIAAAGVLVGPRILVPGLARARSTSKIVRAYHPDATSGWTTINQEPVDLMVHAAVRELTGVSDTAEAWKSLFPGIDDTKKIGIKISLACGDVPTHPEVVNAIVDGLLMMDLGGSQLPEESIIVHDYDDPFFCAQTGYVQNWGGPGVQYVGTSHGSIGFDGSYSFPISHPHGSTTYHSPSRIITEFCDYLINVPVIKDHSDSGVTGCLKNHYGSFSNVSVNEMHVTMTYGDGHTRGEPELNRLLRDELGDKTRLFLMDGTFGLFDGGPGYVPPWHTPPNWAYNSVIAGFDPVAVDRIQTIKINEERVNNGLGTLDPSHVSAAALDPYNLGTDDPAEIDLVEVDASNLAGVEDTGPASGAMALLPPYPNPTRAASTLRFRCPEEADAEMLVVDVRGRLVRRISSGRFPAGLHRLAWDGRDGGGRAVASGVYFCRLRVADRTFERRIVMIR